MRAHSSVLSATLLAITLSAPVSAQGWSKIATEPFLAALRPFPGGGALALLTESGGFPQIFTTLQLFDALGNTVWVRELDDPQGFPFSLFTNDITWRPDGSFILDGGQMLFVDAAWQPQWRTLPEATDHATRGVVSTQDGNIASVTLLGDPTYYYYNFWYHLDLRKQAPDGSTLWRIDGFIPQGGYYEPQDLDVDSWGLVELADASLIVVADLEDDDPLLVHVLADGTVDWHFAIDWGSKIIRGTAAPTPSGNALFAFGEGAKTLIGEVDSNSTLLWTRELDMAFPFDLQVDPAGGFVFSGSLLPDFWNGDWVWGRLDPTGNVVVAYRVDQTGSRIGSVAATGSGYLVTSEWDPPNFSRAWTLHSADANGVAGCPFEPLAIDSQPVAPTTYVSGDLVFVSNPNPVLVIPDGTTLLASSDTLLTGCPDSVGDAYCTPAGINSSGAPAEIELWGSALLANNFLRAEARQMPVNKFGYFLTGMGNGITVPPGAKGNLCLAGSSIQRYSKFVMTTGNFGSFEMIIDTTAIPGHGAILVGETWNFQAWFRDKDPLPTSNFTDARSLTFL